MKQNKIPELNSEEEESDSEQSDGPRKFLKKGGGKLGMGRGLSNSSLSNSTTTPAAAAAATSMITTGTMGNSGGGGGGGGGMKRPASASGGASYTSMHSRTLHFKPEPASPITTSHSPTQFSPVPAAKDSLNASADEGGDYQDFERHIKQVHSMFLRSGPTKRAASPPPAARIQSSSAAVTGSAPRSPVVDFSPVMQALEIKLARMTQENISLKSEREALMDSFKEQMDTMALSHERDIAEARRHKEEENKKLKDQLRLMERRQAAVNKHTVMRKERAEIEQLQREMAKMRADQTARESTWKMTTDKIKAANLQLMEKNEELESQLEKALRELESVNEGQWSKERTILQEQIDLLIHRNTQLEAQLADERDVNAALAKLRNESSLGRTLNGLAASVSKSPDAPSYTKPPSPAVLSKHTPPQPSSRSSPIAAIDNPPHDADTRTPFHEKHQVLQQAWTEPRPQLHPTGLNGLSRSVGGNVVTEKKLDNGAVQQLKADGSKVIIFKNGTTKEQAADGRQLIRFANGDVKEVALDGTITYFYKEAKTTHITYPGGLQLIHFPNNQMEKHFPDGSKEIVFANKVRKKVFPDGREQIFS